MKDIRFYDYDHNLVAVIAHVESVNWQVKYNDIGMFELHTEADTPQAVAIMKSEHLVAKQGYFCAVILEKQMTKAGLAVYGRTCNYLLGKRVVLPFEEEAFSDARDAVKRFVPEYMTIVDDSVSEACEKTMERTSPESAECFINAVLGDLELGHEVLFKRGQTGGAEWIFRIYGGAKKAVIISEEAKTASDISYTESETDYYSHGYYNREIKDSDGTVTGSEWVLITKDENEGIYRSEAILAAEDADAAETELSKSRKLREARGSVRRLKFGTDYNLGDIITVQIGRGSYRKASKFRVTEIHIYNEGDGSGEEPTLEEVFEC